MVCWSTVEAWYKKVASSSSWLKLTPGKVLQAAPSWGGLLLGAWGCWGPGPLMSLAFGVVVDVVPVPAGRVHLNLGGARLAGWCSPSSPMVFAVAAAVVAEAFAGLARSWSTCCGPAAVLVVGLLSSGGLCWLPAAGCG